jgi:hypothetical protein
VKTGFETTHFTGAKWLESGAQGLPSVERGDETPAAAILHAD